MIGRHTTKDRVAFYQHVLNVDSFLLVKKQETQISSTKDSPVLGNKVNSFGSTYPLADKINRQERELSHFLGIIDCEISPLQGRDRPMLALIIPNDKYSSQI